MDFPGTPLKWASPVDQSGSYGLTKVTCNRVDFQPGTYGPISLVRSLKRIWDAIVDL